MKLPITSLAALAVATLLAGASGAMAATAPQASPSSGYQGFGSAAASPAAAPSAKPAALTGDAAVAARAKAWLGRLQKGDIDRSQLTPEMDAALTAEVIANLRDHFGPLGPPQSFALKGKNALGGITGYVFRVAWAGGTADFTFAVDDASGKIAGLTLRPGAP
jgi:hypothetical protein